MQQYLKNKLDLKYDIMRNQPKVLYYKDNVPTIGKIRRPSSKDSRLILPRLNFADKEFLPSPLVTTGRLKPQNRLSKDDIKATLELIQKLKKKNEL